VIVGKNNSYSTVGVLLLLGLLGSLPTLRFYAQINGMLLAYAGMLFLPLVFYIKEPEHLSMRFSVLIIANLIFFLLVPSHLVLLFGFYALCFLIIESFLGKLNKLAFVLMLLASPIAYSFFEIFGFPIRLGLTKWATEILNVTGYTCHSIGNVMKVNGKTFSVDPVCMGLNMVKTSMLGSLILISYIEKKRTRYFTNIGLLASLLAALFFVVMANLFRIVMIVLLEAAPGTTLHEAIGICSMIAFVLFPLYLSLPIISKSFSKPPKAKPTVKQVNHLLRNTSIGVFIICFCIANQVHPTFVKETLDQTTRNVSLEGYHKEILKFPNDTEVVALESNQHLIYIKNQYPYRVTNHSPLICWQGNGFEIKNENILEVNHRKVYTAELIADHDKFYTAWWFDNGDFKTIGHLDWRWKVMQGEAPFRLVNVSSRDFSDLYMEVEWLLGEDLFTQ